MARYLIQDLVARLSCNPELRRRLEAATTARDAAAVAREYGLDLDSDDLETLAVAGAHPEALTDHELQAAAGGTANPMSIYVCGATEVLCTAHWICS